jgi:hypothetical protein
MSENAAIERAQKPTGVLVLGLGNVLLGDDGVGTAALTHLERNWRIPPGVRLEDGGHARSVVARLGSGGGARDLGRCSAYR